MEKPKGILNFQALRLFTNLFRLIELILLLVLISKLSFPKLSGDIFKKSAMFLISPRFVFFIGNAIIITLFAKSGRYRSSHECSITTTEATSNDLCKEFLDMSEKKIRSEVYETKPSKVKRVSFERSQSQKAVQPLESRCYLITCDSDKKVAVRIKKLEDRMSNEQFRTKIEAFIARQKRIQKDEEHFII